MFVKQVATSNTTKACAQTRHLYCALHSLILYSMELNSMNLNIGCSFDIGASSMDDENMFFYAYTPTATFMEIVCWGGL